VNSLKKIERGRRVAKKGGETYDLGGAKDLPGGHFSTNDINFDVQSRQRQDNRSDPLPPKGSRDRRLKFRTKTCCA